MKEAIDAGVCLNSHEQHLLCMGKIFSLTQKALSIGVFFAAERVISIFWDCVRGDLFAATGL